MHEVIRPKDLNFLDENDLLPGTFPTYTNPDDPEKVDVRFAGTDNPTSYEKNMKDPAFRKKWESQPITYRVNSNGYRCEEFNKIDWENSVAIIGDSCVYGMGVPRTHVVSYLLEQMIGRTVINLGVGGCSNMFIMYNNMKLLQKYRPWAVINIWTAPERMTLFQKPKVGFTGVRHIGSWDEHNVSYQKFWLQSEGNYLGHTKMCQDVCAQLNRDNRYLNYTPRQFSLNKDTEFPFFGGAARDKLHPDKFTYKMQARYIKEDFIRNGWFVEEDN